MGTRSLTVFKEKDGTEIAVLYRQFDGYVDGGHGEELVTFLKDKKLVNGIREETLHTAFNGMGCLTAAVIAHFKTEIGGFYLYPAGTRNCWEEFIYTVEPDENDNIKVTVEDVYDKKSTVLLGEGIVLPPMLKFDPNKGILRSVSEMKAIRKMMTESEKFIVCFTKKNGEERNLLGTRKGPFIDNQRDVGLNFDPNQKNLLPVWDIENEGYRMVNLKTVYSVKVLK